MNAAKDWFTLKKWKPHAFQKQTWKYISEGYSGMLNAPTGYGKTYAIWFGVIQDFLSRSKKSNAADKGLHCLWITPLRALSKEIENAAQQVSNDLALPYTIGVRTGDTSAKEKAAHKKQMPHALITTPESMHLMLAQKGYAEVLQKLQFVIVDEWHELLGSKRGVQIELAISRMRAINPQLKVWGISATIGNLEEAKDILLGAAFDKAILIKAEIKKKIIIETILPDVLEKFPWAGHLGLKLGKKVLEVIHKNNSTLVFTNTRFQAETWYRHLLELDPDLAGLLALHHGSLDEATRKWVEAALHEGKLKAVVCTSSLDLGVDFRPVDTVIQIGSPKGVARFMQRAGRSGHQPGATSKIYFVPTHSLEIIEGSAMRYAVKNNKVESRIPFIRSFDVLIQYLVTLAVSDGFSAAPIYNEVKQTHCFSSITPEEFDWCLSFITTGGKSLYAYDEFHKVIIEDGIYKVIDRRVALQHRMSMGTIVSSNMLQVKFITGKYLGSIEEWFISRLKPSDVFWFAGKNLEFVRLKDMTVQVRSSTSKKGIIPSWQGGKMPLSTQLAETIRHQLNEYHNGAELDKELTFLAPLLEEQKRRSILPTENELLIEKIKTREGCHVFVYPFEGRYVHEGLAAIMANRIALFKPITFSIAMNDYGFELLSDQDIPIEDAVDSDLFSSAHLSEDILKSVNTTEMAKRRFRDIAAIAGLVFTGFPGKQIKTKHLQASSKLFFSVFEDYEKDNLLLKEAYDELYDFQLEVVRLRNAFERIEKQKIIIKNLDRFSPFSFPIFTERWREKFSNEDIETRIQKMKIQLEKA
ncbi:MAG: ligase-associated DNA damage response DEXH box helicase [Bacteroidia bacterium]